MELQGSMNGTPPVASDTLVALAARYAVLSRQEEADRVCMEFQITGRSVGADVVLGRVHLSSSVPGSFRIDDITNAPSREGEHRSGFGAHALTAVLAEAVRYNESISLLARKPEASSRRGYGNSVSADTNKWLRDYFWGFGFEVLTGGDRYSGYAMEASVESMRRALQGEFERVVPYVVTCAPDQLAFLSTYVSRMGGERCIEKDKDACTVRVGMTPEQLEALKPFAQDFRVTWGCDKDRVANERAVGWAGFGLFDTLDALGASWFSRKTEDACVEEATRRYPDREVVCGSYDEVIKRIEMPFDEGVIEITEEAFDQALKILPPLNLTGATFMSSEPLMGSKRAVYAKYGGRFYEMYGTLAMSERDIFDKIRKGPIRELEVPGPASDKTASVEL